MKTLIKAVVIYAAAVSTWAPSALAQDAGATGPAPLEAFFCNMQSGKTMKDLMEVSGKFSQWADKNNPEYSAWILTPRFGQFNTLPQVIWFGSNPTGNSMGKGLDAWAATGDKLQQEFDEVIACAGHGLASSIEINAPDGPPGDGVVMFVECNIDEDSDRSKAVAAHKQYSAAMRSMGAKNSNWLFFPMLGGEQDRDFDYWSVGTFNSWGDYFAAYELYVTGGGWQKSMELMKDVASCEQGTPTVWDVKLVRQGAPQE